MKRPNNCRAKDQVLGPRQSRKAGEMTAHRFIAYLAKVVGKVIVPHAGFEEDAVARAAERAPRRERHLQACPLRHRLVLPASHPWMSAPELVLILRIRQCRPKAGISVQDLEDSHASVVFEVRERRAIVLDGELDAGRRRGKLCADRVLVKVGRRVCCSARIVESFRQAAVAVDETGHFPGRATAHFISVEHRVKLVLDLGLGSWDRRLAEEGEVELRVLREGRGIKASPRT